MIVAVLVGVICTGIIAFLEQVKLHKRIATLEKKIKEYEPVYKE